MPSIKKLGSGSTMMFDPIEFWQRYDADRYSKKEKKPNKILQQTAVNE